jgi:hypothetical protein
MKTDSKERSGTTRVSSRSNDGAGFRRTLTGCPDDQIKATLVPWSMMEAGEGGFPNRLIQQIILNELGEDVYDGLIDGSIPFTDERVRSAWEMFDRSAWPGECRSGDAAVSMPT